jgi:tetratricopeptide (TPR) repeat protein
MDDPENDKSETKVISNPARDATDSIGGYVYQAYQSVLAWIDLGDDELLILEGSEDFDIYAARQVTTVQVKAGEKNLTLNSSSVVEAIDNFWLCQQRYTDFKVQFRFLTPAQAGKESGDLLAREKGLELWKKCELPGTNVNELRNFLLKSKINDDLKNKIKLWDNGTLKSELITRIKWDLGSRNKKALTSLIEHRLVTYGQQRSCSPRSAKSSLSHLLVYIVNLLSTHGVKELKRSDFLLEFEEATTVTLPNSALLGITQPADHGSHITTRNQAMALLRSPIPLGSYVVGRTQLVEKYLSTLQSTRSLFLVGSTGMGKSYLALLISQKIAVGWSWMPLRNSPTEKYHEYLLAIETLVSNDEVAPYLVLDDLNSYSDIRVAEALAILCLTVHSKSGLVIVTSSEPPTDHLEILGSGLDQIVVKVPGLDETEISDLLTSLGVINKENLKQLSKAIWLGTFGHPQLVHAKAKRFQANNWKTTISEVLDPADLADARTTARKRLLQELPSNDAKLMVYRISIINGIFTRDTALAVAGSPPPLSDSGEKFDQLVGPWVEEIASNQFRLSPLIHNVASDNYSSSQVRELHSTVLVGLLSTGNLDQLSYCQAMFHAYMSRDKLRLLMLFNQFITNSEIRDSQYIMDNLYWLIHVEPDGGHLFSEMPELELILRVVQYYLTCHTEELEAIEISISKVESCTKAAASTDPGKLMVGIAYSCVLINLTAQMSSVTAVRLICKLRSIEKIKIRGQSLFEMNQDVQVTNNVPKIGDGSISHGAFAAQASRVMGTQDYMEFVDALDVLPDLDREYLLEVSESDCDFTRTLVGSAWWKDEQNGILDVDRASSIFSRSDAIAQKWCCDSISIESLVAISVLHNEYGSNSELALTTIEDALQRFPESTELVNQRAKVLFSLDRNADALLETDKVLADTNFNKGDRLFCIRSSGVAAAKLGDWRRAQSYFDKGITNIPNDYGDSEIYFCIAVGMIADAAFALWKQDRIKEAIEKLVEVLGYLPISKEIEDIHRYHLEAAIRHTVLWIHHDAMEALDGSTVEPIPGMCSNPVPNKEIVNQPYVHVSAAWEMLKSLDGALQLGLNIDGYIEKLGFSEKPLLVHRFAASVEISNVFNNYDFERLIPAVVKVVEAQAHAANHGDAELWKMSHSIPRLTSEYWQSDLGVKRLQFDIFSAAVICIVQDRAIPSEQWSSDLSSLDAWSVTLKSFFEIITGKVPSMSSPTEEKLLYTLKNIKTQAIQIEELWMFNFRLLEVFFKGDRSFIGPALRELTCRIWAEAVTRRKFAFVLPQIGIPKIDAALNYKGTDEFNEIGQILATVSEHISLKVGSDAIDQLKNINLKS